MVQISDQISDQFHTEEVNSTVIDHHSTTNLSHVENAIQCLTIPDRPHILIMDAVVIEEPTCHDANLRHYNVIQNKGNVIMPTTNDAFYMQFAQYDTKGQIDLKKTSKLFEESFLAWVKSQSEFAPTITNQLEKYGKLGRGDLVKFVLHALEMNPVKENSDRIEAVIDDLERAGKIVYLTPESGRRRGRGTGYMLPERAKKILSERGQGNMNHIGNA